jgi:hypothetical protein
MNEKYKTGDILVVGTWPIPLFDHFAIVFYRNGVGYVAHNSFRSEKIIISGLDEFVNSRTVRRVISTDGKLSDEYIYNKTVQLNQDGKTYNFFGYNCESYVREVCDCDWGADQRKEFLLFMAVVIIIGIIACKTH